MKKHATLVPSLLAAAIIGVTAVSAHADSSTDAAVKAQLQDYKATMQAFGKTLKGELQTAMKEGGPMDAVQVCNQRAPEIAADLSEESGYT
ncbi:MAG: hypothetical protein ABR561_04260, partial [Guyparkeria sp.]